MIYQFERSRIERCDGCDFFYGGVDGMSYEYGYCTRHEDIIDGHKTPHENDCPLLAISKTETTSCEWCEKTGKYAGFAYATFFEQTASDEEYEFSVKCSYCPNCGRKLD